MTLESKNVAFVQEPRATKYCSLSPFHASEPYPEYPFGETSREKNWGYELVRRLLFELQLDREHFGTPQWNPLGLFIKPGDTVLLKPNLVSHINHGFKGGRKDTDSLVTHGSVIRAVADYVAISLSGKGRIVVADAPIQSSDWESIRELTGLAGIEDWYRRQGIRFDSADLRLEIAATKNEMVVGRQIRAAHEEYEEIDLGVQSLLTPIISQWEEFAVSAYALDRMKAAHNPARNAYLLHKLALEADCVVNLPKLKTHTKAGISCALKNMVGIIGHKDYLPHFRLGGARLGGDEYPNRHPLEDMFWGAQHRIWREASYWRMQFYHTFGTLLYYLMPNDVVSHGQGSWYLNDTLWRTILDINRVFFYYSTSSHSFVSKPERRYLAIVDGIVGGENESPLSPTPVNSGCVIGGFNPAAVDVIAATVMGFDYQKIPSVSKAFQTYQYPLVEYDVNEINVRQNDCDKAFEAFVRRNAFSRFQPSAGWRGKIEKSLEVDA
jgi:uncharacterized protein (DUF362 family)